MKKNKIMKLNKKLVTVMFTLLIASNGFAATYTATFTKVNDKLWKTAKGNYFRPLVSCIFFDGYTKPGESFSVILSSTDYVDKYTNEPIYSATSLLERGGDTCDLVKINMSNAGEM